MLYYSTICEIALTETRLKELDSKILDYSLHCLSIVPTSKVACQIMTDIGKELIRYTSTSLPFTKLGLLMPWLLEPIMILKTLEPELIDDSAIEQATIILFKATQTWEQQALKAAKEPKPNSYKDMERAVNIISQLARNLQHPIWFDRPTIMAIWDIARLLT